MNKTTINQPRPEQAGHILAKLGFGIEPWTDICSHHGLPAPRDDDLLKGDRNYGIIYPFAGFEYILGILSCNTPTEIRKNMEDKVNFDRPIKKGFFYDFDIDYITERLDLWNKDTDKKDETRFPIYRSQTIDNVLYHVKPLFDADVVVEKLANLSCVLERCGYEPAHCYLDDPRHFAFLNE